MRIFKNKNNGKFYALIKEISDEEAVFMLTDGDDKSSYTIPYTDMLLWKYEFIVPYEGPN